MATTYDPQNLLAQSPPRGWNSYNSLGGMHGLPADADPHLPGGVALSERAILQTAEALVSSGLAQSGYEYLNIDDRWQNPAIPRDRAGILQTDRRRFPHGIKYVADRVHELGLKFGIYTIGNTVACGGEEGTGPCGFPETGSLGYERIDAETFADWGVDFLKIDWCGVDQAGNRGRAPDIFSLWNDAIKATGRPIVLSASTWGEEKEETWGSRLTHMWRTTGDLHPTWESILSIAQDTGGPRWQNASGREKGWNDPDFLQVGHSALSIEESWTHMALWSMLSAPLIAGNDVRTMSSVIRRILIDPDLLTINSDVSAPAVVRTIDSWQVWRRQLSSGAEVHAVVNLLPVPAMLPDNLEFPGRVVSISERTDEVPSHGTRLTIGQDRQGVARLAPCLKEW